MTSAQTMRMGLTARRLAVMSLALLLCTLLISGCMNQTRLERPAFLHAPYPEPQLWAIAPFMNESGFTDIDTATVADVFAEQLQDVDGILTVPVNRVIRAMRELEIDTVQTEGEARLLMNLLNVDGLIVGTISGYDPYRPPKIAAAVELHVQPRQERHNMLDTRSLSRVATGHAMPGEIGPNNPVAQAAGVFDAANHRTLAQLRDYTRGRHVPDSAFGPDIYLVRMDLYAQFVSFRLIHDLLMVERARVAPIDDEGVAHAHER